MRRRIVRSFLKEIPRNTVPHWRVDFSHPRPAEPRIAPSMPRNLQAQPAKTTRQPTASIVRPFLYRQHKVVGCIIGVLHPGTQGRFSCPTHRPLKRTRGRFSCPGHEDGRETGNHYAMLCPVVPCIEQLLFQIVLYQSQGFLSSFFRIDLIDTKPADNGTGA